MKEFSLPKMPRFSPIFLLLVFILIILLAGGVFYWRFVRKSPASEETTQPYIGEMVTTGKVDVYLSPGGEKVGYFVPRYEFASTGEQEGDWIEVIDGSGYELWIEKNGNYQPGGK